MSPTLATLLTISISVIAAILVLILIFLIPALFQVRRTALFLWNCLRRCLYYLSACDSSLLCITFRSNWSIALLMLITRKDFGLAALINENSGPIIGVARYAYDPQSEMPELAVAVRDDWQGNGPGSLLFIRVIKVGREHGYSRFGAQ